MTIGQVARSAGVHLETIRYYQGLGLVDEPPRRQGTVRRYGPEAVSRLLFIKRAQQLGFTLEEVKALLPQGGRADCSATRKLAETKLVFIKERIVQLTRVRRTLEALIAQCSAGEAACCPIIEMLSGGTQEAANDAVNDVVARKPRKARSVRTRAA
jgi:MerR family mercuric resistance operon transcriptional regulator